MVRTLGLERREHAAEIEIARLDKVRQRLGVEKHQRLGLQLGQLPAEGLGIGDDTSRGLLEGDKDSRFPALPRAMHQELQRENGLAGTGSTGQQRRSALRQTAAGNLIETGDAGRRFA
jgi:hypothetical protein